MLRLPGCIALSLALLAFGCNEKKSEAINWEHPSARGIVFLSVASATGAPRDYVSGTTGALLDGAAPQRLDGGPAAVDLAVSPDSRLQFAEKPAFAELRDLTILTRFFPTSLNLWQPLMVKEESRTAIKYGLWIRPSNTLFLEIAGAKLEGRKPLEAGRWHSIAAARAGNTAHFYVNGELGSTGSLPGTITPGGDLWIGDVSNGRDDAQGYWHYGVIYDRALTEEEIRQWHSNPDQLIAALTRG